MNDCSSITLDDISLFSPVGSGFLDTSESATVYTDSIIITEEALIKDKWNYSGLK